MHKKHYFRIITDTPAFIMLEFFFRPRILVISSRLRGSIEIYRDILENEEECHPASNCLLLTYGNVSMMFFRSVSLIY